MRFAPRDAPLCLVALAFLVAALPARGDDAADARGLAVFTGHLRELLAHRCVGCHGAGTVESDFDMSTREKLLAGGAGGVAVVPGKATESRMYRLAARLEEPHMPEEGDALTEEELRWLAEWINRGAPYDKPLVDAADRGPWTERTVKPEARDFWSFRPLARGEPPRPSDPQGWCRNPIDQFILARQEKVALSPSPPTDPQTLRRRIAFDLTGLPATPEEIAAFGADSSEAAYGRVVDDLLTRPAFGERWAQHWLDVARFAESFGYEQDYDRPFAFHYRDFVIKAFNDDLPYDTFLQWQIAGDELAPGNLEARKATGFLAAGAFPTQLTEKEFESARSGELDDMVATCGTAMLGITIGCARCHDHKFDPVPQADYYRFASTFTTTIRANIDVEVHAERHREAVAAWQQKLDAGRAAVAVRERELAGGLESFAQSWRTQPQTVTPVWRLGTLVSATAQSGVVFAPQADGSLLATGQAAARDAYTIVIDTPLSSVAAIRLDALSDASLPKAGPGRAGNGNFALSNLTVSMAPLPPPQATAADRKRLEQPRVVKLAAARADFSQTRPDLAVAHAIDADGGSAWAVDPQIGKAHAAAFDFAAVESHPHGMRLTVKLEFNNNAQHAIGRPRLAVAATAGLAVEPVTSAADPLAPQREQSRRLDELVAKGAETWTATDREAVASLRRHFDERWRELDAVARRIEAEKPKPELVKLLVAGENLPHIPHHADGRGYPHFYKETHFLRRGDVNQKEGVAEPGFLQVLVRDPAGLERWRQPPAPGSTSSHRRAALARWIVDPDQGAGQLAARVIVNRLWQHHFGVGLVATPSDFGKQGDPPSHPELLDWLAAELIRGGWKLKPIHRLMLTSATYRQASGVDAKKAAIDPENRLVWRYNRRRLEGEAIRDTFLSFAGVLKPDLYGRAGRDEAVPRRSLYLEMKRSKLPLFLRTFDAPDYVSGVAKRSSTTTAPQALAIMNSPTVRRWAEEFAARLTASAATVPLLPVKHSTAATAAQPASPGGDGDARVIQAAYATAVGRSATASELHDAELFLQGQRAAYTAAGKQPAQATTLAVADFCQVLMGLNETLHIE